MGKIKDKGRDIIYAHKDFLEKMKSSREGQVLETHPFEQRTREESHAEEPYDLSKQASESHNAEIEPPDYSDMENHQIGEQVETTTIVREIGRYSLNEEPPQAVVIHCGDPRFQKAFRKFLENELGLKNYVPIIIGGGIHSFGVKDLLPKHFKILWEQIKFLLKDGGISRVVIINHEDCRWYRKFEGYAHGIPLLQKGIIDLEAAAGYLAKEFLRIEVRAYMARLEGKEIFFDRI